MTKKLCLLVVVCLAGCGKHSDKIGVAECDAYEDKMAACASKIGGDNGEGLTKMRKMMLEAWKKDAESEDTRAYMPKTCNQAVADMKKQFPQCDW
jgi:uncharacterized protein (DUF885 family)